MTDIPKSVTTSLHFQNLIAAKIIESIKSGRGSKIVIKNIESFESFFSLHFSEEEVAIHTKASNIRKLRNSKARKTKSPSIFFLRGFRNISLNNETFDVAHYTNLFGVFSVLQPMINADRICFVENLDSFLKAEKLLGEDYLYLHKYGRIGVDSLKGIIAKEILVFVDYDFNGLDEYIRIKGIFENAVLFMPDNFDELFVNYSKVIDGKQQQSKKVADSLLLEVVKIRELVSRTNRFLEQEIIIND